MKHYLQTCGPCGPCGGKWIGVLAKVIWYGNEGYFSTATCGGCDYSANDSEGSASHRYLKLVTACSGSATYTQTFWQWNGSSWEIDEPTPISYTGNKSGSYQIDRLRGDTFVSGCTDTEAYDDSGGFTSTGQVPITLGPIGTTNTGSRTVFHWEALQYRCGLYTSLSADTSYFQGGDVAALEDYLTTGGLASGTVVFHEDTVSDDHIGFTITQDDLMGPFDSPVGDPGGGPTRVLRSSHIEGDLSVSFDLSDVFDFQDLCNQAAGLLGTYPMNTNPFYDETNTCQTVHMVRHNYNPGGVWNGGVACDYVPNPIYDGGVLGVPGATPLDPDINIPWGAFKRFIPDSNPLNGGILYMAKWAMRQGCYKPLGWQDAATKVWSFLLQTWGFKFCELEASYSCENKTGADKFVMCVSPSGETWANGETFWPFNTTPWDGGERAGGSSDGGELEQAVCRDSIPDPWNTETHACDPMIAVVEVPVEPTCECGCPDGADTFRCSAPLFGDCPCATGELCVEPDDSTCHDYDP